MVNPNTGVNFGIFTGAIAKYGAEVTITPVSNTPSNFEGDDNFQDASSVTAQAYFSRRNRPWFFDKASNIEGGDAILLALPSTTIERYYKVTYNGNTYRVENVLNRDQIGGNVAYKACNLFLI